MAGFVRRFTSTPSIEVLSEIEAVDIVDLPPQSPTTGTGSGTLLCVGEFEDGGFADGSDASEWVGARGPQEVFGSEDLVNRFGGFGYTYGTVPSNNICARAHLFESFNGNGFLKLKFCRPRRLIISRVDTSVGQVAFSPLAAIIGGAGPFNLTVGDVLTVTTDVGGPVSSTAIAAAEATVTGAVFVASGFVGGESVDFTIDGGPTVRVSFAAADQTPAQVAARINLVLGYAAASVVLGALQIVGIRQGTGGSVVLADGTVGALASIGLVAGSTAGTGNVANLSRVTPAEVAAIVNGTAGLAANNCSARVDAQGRIRIFRDSAPGTILIASTSMAIACALSPLATTVTAGEHSGGIIMAGTRIRTAGGDEWVTMQTLSISEGSATSPNLGPHVVKVRPAVDDGTSLGTAAFTTVVLVDMPDFADFDVTNPNALTAALTEPQMDVAYETAFTRTIDLASVVREVNFSISARRSDAVVSVGKANAIDASAGGMFGRKFLTGAPLGFTISQAIADVGLNRSDRVFYTFPGWRVRVPEIAFRGTAGGAGFTDDGIITVRADGPLATLVCQLAPEENPGQATGLIENFFAVEDVYSGSTTVPLTIDSYIAFKRNGICAPRRDPFSGSIYQSGITSSITPGLTTQARRKMADFIQDSLATRLVPFSKRLATQSRLDGIRSVIEQFLSELQSVNNPETARIDSYLVDETSAQTPELTARGIFAFIIKVRTLSSLDAIVLQTEIGEGVVTVAEEA